MGFTDRIEKYNLPRLGWTRLPPPPITNNDKLAVGLSENCSNYEMLEKLSFIGLDAKILNGQINKEEYQKYKERYEYELNVFKELHFTDYILLVWKVINKAKELGVFLDFGRGSVGSSLVSWLLDISGCDPIKYNLFFTRFVSKARAKSKEIDGNIWISNELAPDVDINLGNARDEIINWLKQTYPNRVCKVSNVSTLTGKALIKDVYKCYEGASEDEAKMVSDLIERRFGVVQDIKDAYKENEEFKEWSDKHNETYLIACKLQNLIRHQSSHASGYLISYDELENHTPISLDSEKEPISSYTMDYAQSLKLDLLGLETNSILKKVFSQIKEVVNDIRLEDDPIIYNQFQNNDLLSYGLYQISADCAYRVCMNLKPKNVMELSHVNAIARPSALAYEKPYVENNAQCPHPIFEKALNWTRYQPLYQEQTLMMVKAIGFDDESAEQFRRVFAKKKLDEIKGWVVKIENKLKENNIPKEAGDVLIKLAEESANYQFNFSHSLMTSYLTALTVYLKYKHPLEFYLSCLSEIRNKADFTEKIGEIIAELPYFNLKLLPPHLIKSELNFSIESDNIRFGLSSVKGISEKIAERLTGFKHIHNNKFDLFNNAKKCGLSIGHLSCLIQSGCLDDMLTQTRSKTVLEAQTWNLLTIKEKQYCLELGESRKFDLLNLIKELNTTIKDEKSKPIIKDSRMGTIKKHYEPYKQIYLQNSKNEELANYWFEKSLLGFSYSQSLKGIFQAKVEEIGGDIYNIREINENEDLQEREVRFAAEVTEIKEFVARNAKKTKCLKLTTSDETGSLTVMLFNDKIDETYNLNGRKFQEGDIIVVRGNKKKDCVFSDTVAIQNLKIYQKLSDLKEIKE